MFDPHLATVGGKTMLSCWNCAAHVELDTLFCPACEALQPPRAGRDFFQILEVPRTFGLEPELLEQSFKRLSRRLHPDRFATASDRARRLSLEHATALNDAYRTLRVPTKRAEYLLGLWGRPISESNKVTLPMEFLEELMELREKVAEAKFERDPEAVSALLGGAERQWQSRYQVIEGIFAAIEAESDAGRRADLIEGLELELHKLRYLQSLLTEQGIVPTPAAPTR